MSLGALPEDVRMMVARTLDTKQILLMRAACSVARLLGDAAGLDRLARMLARMFALRDPERSARWLADDYAARGVGGWRRWFPCVGAPLGRLGWWAAIRRLETLQECPSCPTPGSVACYLRELGAGRRPSAPPTLDDDDVWDCQPYDPTAPGNQRQLLVVLGCHHYAETLQRCIYNLAPRDDTMVGEARLVQKYPTFEGVLILVEYPREPREQRRIDRAIDQSPACLIVVYAPQPQDVSPMLMERATSVVVMGHATVGFEPDGRLARLPRTPWRLSYEPDGQWVSGVQYQPGSRALRRLTAYSGYESSIRLERLAPEGSLG